MDPNTTLIVFMLRTAPSINTVDLIGSWDNFSRRYPMERDLRRGMDQWKGLHSFKDITNDGGGVRSRARAGGLKMGQEYYYYYELDASTEVHDSTRPSTTSCPYLPGQEVNSLWIPIEASPLRDRSASTSNLASSFDSYKTMNPNDKFLTPRAPPPIPKNMIPLRVNTSPALLTLGRDMTSQRESMSASPQQGKNQWRSRFGGLKSLMSPISARSPSRSQISSPMTSIPFPTLEGESEHRGRLFSLGHSSFPPSSHTSTSSRSRDISPPADHALPFDNVSSTFSYHSRNNSPRRTSSQRQPYSNSRDTSPMSIRRNISESRERSRNILAHHSRSASNSRDPSPLRNFISSPESGLHTTILTLPEEIIEEEEDLIDEDDEDDANFADTLLRSTTLLTPRPQNQNTTLDFGSLDADMKALPSLPPPTPEPASAAVMEIQKKEEDGPAKTMIPAENSGFISMYTPESIPESRNDKLAPESILESSSISPVRHRNTSDPDLPTLKALEGRSSISSLPPLNFENDASLSANFSFLSDLPTTQDHSLYSDLAATLPNTTNESEITKSHLNENADLENAIPIPFKNQPRSHFSIESTSTFASDCFSPGYSSRSRSSLYGYDGWDSEHEHDNLENPTPSLNSYSSEASFQESDILRAEEDVSSPAIESAAAPMVVGSWKGYSLPEELDAGGSELTLVLSSSSSSPTTISEQQQQQQELLEVEVERELGKRSVVGRGVRTTFGPGILPPPSLIGVGVGGDAVA